MRLDARPLAAACVTLLALVSGAGAQQPGAGAQDSATAARRCGAPASADSTGIPVVIVARVHADALVFESDPDVRVTLNGCPPPPGATSTNLPHPVVPGVRYTDVQVRTEYRVWLDLECSAPTDAAARFCELLERSD